MAAVKVALDWTPNTNHVGFYVAKAQGLYTKAGLDVTFISPHTDSYKTTPASRVESGGAMFAIAPSESVISYNTWPEADRKRPKLKAVAALLQQDTSAVVTLKSSGIDRPAKLEGKRYASYAARYEGRIVQQMIRNDGGTGQYQELVLPMLGLWNTLLRGEAEATWVFMGWEGVEAARQGVELNAFRRGNGWSCVPLSQALLLTLGAIPACMRSQPAASGRLLLLLVRRLGDHGIPYGYSPVLLAHPDVLSSQAQTVRAFLAATAEGYRHAAAHPDQAADALVAAAAADHPDLPQPLDGGMCRDSMQLIAQHLLAEDGRWGVMQQQRWDAFLDWLSESGLLTTKVQSRTAKEGVTTSLDALRAGDAGERIPREAVDAASLFTNDFLP